MKTIAKKVVCIIISVLILVSSASCGNSNPKSKEITLTSSNISQYLAIKGEFTHIKAYPIASYATLDLELYPTAPGFFKNVVIKMEIQSIESAFTVPASKGYRWHFRDDCRDDICNEPLIISITLATDGKYSNQYEIACHGDKACSVALRGNCTFKILSINGTFVEN